MESCAPARQTARYYEPDWIGPVAAAAATAAEAEATATGAGAPSAATAAAAVATAAAAVVAAELSRQWGRVQGDSGSRHASCMPAIMEWR
jgi:hypothetical protein